VFYYDVALVPSITRHRAIPQRRSLDAAKISGSRLEEEEEEEEEVLTPAVAR
jgi:hypothetical protein